jgi:hypothetical protein
MNGSTRHALVLLALTVLMVLSVASPALANVFGLRFEGGTILPYDKPGDVGNGAQLVLTLDVKDLQLALGLGIVLPTSRTAAALPTAHLTCQWHPWRRADWSRSSLLSPYASLGAGLAGTDALDESDEGVEDDVVRWVGDQPEFLGQLGLGLTFGEPEGIYLLTEARSVNLSHGVLVLGAGFRF